MRIETGRLLVDADAGGRIVGVAHRSRPSRPIMSLVDLGACRVDGADVALLRRDVATDTDEIAVRTDAGGLELALRHSFSTGWTTRLLIVNPGTTTRVLERLQLTACPATGQRVSAMAAGSRLCWAAQPSDGHGPVLTARLTTGAVSQVTQEGFELGVLRLAPGQRYVTQLRWELFATPRSVVAGPGRDVLVSRTTFAVGEPVLLPEDPDAALVAPAEVAIDVVEDAEASGREVSAAEPGRHRIELRAADGDVRLDLSWVRPLVDRLALWSTAVLAGARTSAGVVVVDDLSPAVVVQAALGAGRTDDADQAADALDRLTGRLVEDAAAQRDSLAVLYLLGEHARTGDGDVLAAALAGEAALLAEDCAPPAGLGLAVLRTVLVGLDAAERLVPLVARAVERSAAVAGTGRDPSTWSEVARQAAELELLLAVRPLLPDDHPTEQRLATLVAGLGAALGSGLPGRLLTPPPVAEHAHVVGVLTMLPEDGVPSVTRSWGGSVSLLAQRWTLEVLDRLGDAEVGPAAAWLALVPRHA